MAKDGIKELITNCSLTNFQDFKKVKNYVIGQLNLHPENSFDESYWYLEMMFEDGSKYLQNKPELIFYLNYIEKCKLIFRYIFMKYLEKTKDVNLQTYASLFSNSLWIATSISALLVNRCNQSVISEYRTFYENFIILSYLKKHPELIEAYNDHFTVCSYKVGIEYGKIKTPQEIDETQYLKIIEKYGKSFSEDYGWMSLIEKNHLKRNLETMFKESDLHDAYSALYKHACKFTHSTSYSVHFKPDYEFLIQFIIALVGLLKQQFNFLFDNLKMVTKEKEILRAFIEILSDNIIQRF